MSHMIVVNRLTATECKTCTVQVFAYHMTCSLAWCLIMYADGSSKADT